MKNIRITLTLSLAALTLIACRKDGVEIKEVSFTADKTKSASNTPVVFTIGDGADALAIYTGDASHNFEFSRLNLVEMKGYTEEQLRSSVYALRVPNIRDYFLEVPRLSAVPQTISYTGQMEFYEGKLVPYDFSNATNSKYLKFTLADGNPQTITFKMDSVVVPEMLKYAAAQLRNLGALNSAPNNNFNPQLAFPDGFDTSSTTGISVRFGVQFLIDAKESPVTYFNATVRELTDDMAFNLTNAIRAFVTANPTLDYKKGISEMRLILNADNPTDPADDGDLLSYKGNVYMQQVAVGIPDNGIKSFDEGVSIPFVFPNSTTTYTYTYTTPGVYTATLVATYIGKKKYSGDGYITNRANEINASEYNIERRLKTVTITVE